MTELSDVLDRLGLSQYLERFVDEGFDRWETVLDITEQDLATLNVKLGHRRILQREIASARGHSSNQPLTQNQFGPLEEVDQDEKSSQIYKADSGKATQPTGKRKYRRHPKPDDSAPEKPPSAYVMFANRVRDELKGQNLSFTDIAKLVGEKWKVLAPEDKESYEYEASVAKDKYNSELQEYKKTENYKEYVKYLAEFKSKTNKEGKEGSEQAESSRTKRPKLESLPSISSASASASGGSAASALSATAPLAGIGLSSSGSGSLSSGQSAYNPLALTPSSVYPSGTQSVPQNATPLSPIRSSSIPTDIVDYKDSVARTTQQQQETYLGTASDTDSPHFFHRIHPVQQPSSYLRHQPPPMSSPASRPVFGSTGPLRRRHDEPPAVTPGSISSSSSSSAPSLTPLTPSMASLDENTRSQRALPLPHTIGSPATQGYFDQRVQHYQSQPRSPRAFAPPPQNIPGAPLAHPQSYTSSPSNPPAQTPQPDPSSSSTAPSSGYRPPPAP